MNLNISTIKTHLRQKVEAETLTEDQYHELWQEAMDDSTVYDGYEGTLYVGNDPTTWIETKISEKGF
tara:strand:+ start:157 stop:357 length:201 start_codon:yes stop_codon:yes gene_type:complete